MLKSKKPGDTISLNKEFGIMIGEMEIIKRLILAAILGGLIGVEREINNRPAGLRTHVLVTLGSTLVMLVSIDGLYMLSNGNMVSDPYRLAAQVVSGIGFLGAGTIMRTGNTIKGLTTAASLWVCAGIGLAIGTGYYLGGIVTSAIVLITLTSLGFYENKMLGKRYKTFEIIGTDRPGLIGEIGTLFGKRYISIKDICIVDNDYQDENNSYGLMEVHFMVNIPSNFNLNLLSMEIYSILGVKSVVFEDTVLSYSKIDNNKN